MGGARRPRGDKLVTNVTETFASRVYSRPMSIRGASSFVVGALLSLALVSRAHVARADDPAAAGPLFDRGLADMQAGRYDTGCPALADSYRLDPRPGTLFTLAECEAKAGKIGSALAHYRDYLARWQAMPPDQQTRQRERRDVATKQVAELAPLVPQLTITLRSPAPGTKVLRDDAELGSASLGVPLPVDPGDHVIVVLDATGHQSSQTVHVGKGESKAVELEAPQETPSTPSSGGGGFWRPLIYTTAGIGAAGIVLSLVTGAVALGKKGDISAGCNDTVCTPDGKAAADSAQTFAAVSTVTFIVGVTFGAASLVLFLVEPSHPKAARLFVSPTVGGAAVGLAAPF